MQLASARARWASRVLIASSKSEGPNKRDDDDDERMSIGGDGEPRAEVGDQPPRVVEHLGGGGAAPLAVGEP